MSQHVLNIVQDFGAVPGEDLTKPMANAIAVLESLPEEDDKFLDFPIDDPRGLRFLVDRPYNRFGNPGFGASFILKRNASKNLTVRSVKNGDQPIFPGNSPAAPGDEELF